MHAWFCMYIIFLEIWEKMAIIYVSKEWIRYFGDRETERVLFIYYLIPLLSVEFYIITSGTWMPFLSTTGGISKEIGGKTLSESKLGNVRGGT